MRFTVSHKTLQRLEWDGVLALLAGAAATPGGRARFATDGDGPPNTVWPGFEATLAGVRDRLAETSEARAVLSTGDRPPLGGVVDLGSTLRRARVGGVLSARELRDVAATLAALGGTERFLRLRAEAAPRLAELADAIEPWRDLERVIEAAFDPSGEIRDGASPALRDARAEARHLSSDLQRRIERILRSPDVAPHLSDRYYTVRGDRYVLPVRADARRGVRGIVHDASSSGTTLFVEPEALVDANNRLKRAEIAIEHESLRVLRDLTARAAEAADSIEASLDLLTAIDAAFARADLAERLDATCPEVGEDGVLRLPQLRHPALPPDTAVPNDLRLGESFTVLVLSGPNAGGKTVAMKAIALAALFVRAGLHVPAAAPARVDLFDTVLADIGDEQDIRESLSTFSAHMANLAEIVDRAGPRSLVVLDEVGVGTDPGEGAALAQSILEALADGGARTVATTHYNLLKEMAEVDDRFANASVEFDPETLEPTYRLHIGRPGSSSATAVAARMGLRGDVLARAVELLDREDRRLDRMLAELAASRAALDSEQRELTRARLETEAARDEHRAKLEMLQARRDRLFREMRDDLDRAFRDAHESVADVIRGLQRGGTPPDPARAREQLLALEERARDAEEETRVEVPPTDPVDWRRARAGDAVRVAGSGRGILLALPDRRGRVAVRVGSARVLVPAERVGADAPAAVKKTTPAVTVVPAPGGDGERDSSAAGDHAGRCDLRGLRVDEALDRLLYALDRAAGAGRGTLLIVHGLGTGALCDAVRRYLAESAYIASFAPGSPEEGGDGVTLAQLAE